MGGDLVDIAENSNEWIVYIADISGHGVASGLLMAMFKTAIRSGLGANVRRAGCSRECIARFIP